MRIYKRKMYCEPLTSNISNRKLIKSFYIEREHLIEGVDSEGGLECYLKRYAWDEDTEGLTKVYVIKTYFTHEIVAYFALKCGMIGISAEERLEYEERKAMKNNTKLMPDTISGIELAQFAVNDNFRNKHKKKGKPLKGLGKYLYPSFVFPYVKKTVSLIGAKAFYLYSVDGDELANYYESEFGFHKTEDVLITPIKPYYDRGCYFMYQILE